MKFLARYLLLLAAFFPVFTIPGVRYAEQAE